MASSSFAVPPSDVTPEAPHSFWTRESRHTKQGIKTGLAGLIAYAIYVGFHLPEGFWIVTTALVVTQANLGASWQAALYRLVGTSCGALSAGLLSGLFGFGDVRKGILIFVLSAVFIYVSTEHPAFSVAGITAALVLLIGDGQMNPWRLAWLRVLYTISGAVIAFGVNALLWPVRAQESLQARMAEFLERCGELYAEVMTAALGGNSNEDRFQPLTDALATQRQAITQHLEEMRGEAAWAHSDYPAYVDFVGELDRLRQRLAAMSRDVPLYADASPRPALVPSLVQLAEKTARNLRELASRLRTNTKHGILEDLDEVAATLDEDIRRLRRDQFTASSSLEQMLPFWAFIFNLREVAESVKVLDQRLPQLA
jgi:uncharacterized membrane protein YccC